MPQGEALVSGSPSTPKRKRKKGAVAGSFFPCVALSRPGLQLALGLPRGFLFAQLRPAALFAWLFIVLTSAQLFVHSAPFDELLEPAKRQPNRFPLMDPHS